MKTLTTLISTTLFASIAAISVAQAAPMSENELYDVIHPESVDIFTIGNYQRSAEAELVSLGDAHNSDSVWSYEYEEYINPADLQRSDISSVDGINQRLGKNPTASGPAQREVFIYNETAGEYHLQ